jgi:hypothetical protein
MSNDEKLADRYRRAKQEEERRKQGERDGEHGEYRKQYRETLDDTPTSAKIISFAIWGGILLLLFWIFF